MKNSNSTCKLLVDSNWNSIKQCLRVRNPELLIPRCFRQATYELLEELRDNSGDGMEHLKEITETTDLMNGNEDTKTHGSTTHGNSAGTLRKSIRESTFGKLFLSWTDAFRPGHVPVTLMFIAFACSSAVLVMLLFNFSNITSWWYITLLCVFFVIIILCLLLMSMYVQDHTVTTYKVS